MLLQPATHAFSDMEKISDQISELLKSMNDLRVENKENREAIKLLMEEKEVCAEGIKEKPKEKSAKRATFGTGSA